MEKIIIRSLLFLLSVFIFLLMSAYRISYPSGPPAGYTGSPADGKTCTQCHGGSATTVSGIISSDVPSSGYIPGTTYTITVTIPGDGNKGFQLSPQNASGTLLGVLTAGAGTQIISSKYIQHNAAKSADPAIWTFQWTSPNPGVGAVTFYGAFVKGKPNVSKEAFVIEQDQSMSLEEKSESGLRCYYDFFSDKLVILPLTGLKSIQVFTSEGRLVLASENLELTGKRFEKYLNLRPGVYLVKINLDEQVLIEKILVNK